MYIYTKETWRNSGLSNHLCCAARRRSPALARALETESAGRKRTSAKVTTKMELKMIMLRRIQVVSCAVCGSYKKKKQQQKETKTKTGRDASLWRLPAIGSPETNATKTVRNFGSREREEKQEREAKKKVMRP